MSFLLRALASVALLVPVLISVRAEVELHPNDTILFYGNSFVERLAENGTLEAWVQLANPDKHLHFRSLAWTGDEVGHRLRAEGYAEHMKSLLAEWPAQVVVAGFGMNESFAGTGGLTEFRSELKVYLGQLARQHPQARLVLVSPTAAELGGQIRDTVARNRDVAAYARVMAEVATERGILFVDMFTASHNAFEQTSERLTLNGLHFNSPGNQLLGKVLAKELLGEKALAQVPAARVPEVARAVAQKNHYVAEVVRPKNADLYYGVRKRPEENAAEIPRYHRMIQATEAIIYSMVAAPNRSFASYPTPWVEPLPPGNGHDDGKSTGIIKPPAEAMVEFKVADGYAVNLFASEEQFPELKNPVQIAFDARGRLWVVTMPSFPHTVPGLPPEDRIVVLEDTDHDGKADKLTVFADGLDALDGVAFHERGVIISEQPRLWLMQDTDGDGRADTKTELLRGIDVTDSHHGGMIATDPIGHVWFCDGVFHRSQIETPYGVHRAIDSTTFRLNPRTGRVETEWQSITPNPWKITFDRHGNAFQMYGDGLVLDGLPLTWTPMGIYHPFAYAQTVGYGKGSAAASISSPNFPPEYQQGMASAALLGSYTVSLTKYDYDQGMVRGSGRLDILSSPNPAFRPADVEFGMDGALYVSDFCSPIIGHAQHPMRDPHWDHTHGRIWRVVNTSRPVVKDWPRIEGASVAELLALLTHPQDLVRHHARIGLRKVGAPMLPALDAWIAAFDRTRPEYDGAILEALFVAEGLGQTRLALLTTLLQSAQPAYRGAATRLIRYEADRLPDPVGLLEKMALDPHPRVQMEVVDAVAHLRSEMPAVEHALHGLTAPGADVKHMLADLRHGTRPAKGRSVPVLEFAPETQLNPWLWSGPAGSASPVYHDARNPSSTAPGAGVYRTYLRSDDAQTATIATRSSFLDIAVNGEQLLSHDSQWSSEQQVQLELQPGVNVIEFTFRNLKGAPPRIHLFDSLGQPLLKVGLPADEAGVRGLLAAWEKANQDRPGTLRVQASAGLQFRPRELRVKAGTPVHLIFENPDIMIHNFVLVQPDAAEEVGTLADQLAKQPNALARQYVPESPKILQSTRLINPKARAQLDFTAPSQPGRYPYLCTFPGHWRIMRGVLIVE